MRRSRTVSFLRPLSQASNRSEGGAVDVPSIKRRTSSISSQRASRPPSLSYSTTGSEASVAPSVVSQPQSTVPAAEASSISRLALLGSSANSTAAKPTTAATTTALDSASIVVSTATTNTTATRDAAPTTALPQPSSKGSNRSGIASIPEESVVSKITPSNVNSEACSCGCHDPPLPSVRRCTYADASVQTDPIPSPPRTALRVDTFSASSWSSNSYSAVSRDLQTPIFENAFSAVPFSMGRMENYFSKPGYQLGDSLSSGYQYYEQPVYQYQDNFGDEVLR